MQVKYDLDSSGEFSKRKFDKRGIPFCAVFVFQLYVNYSAELDVYYNCGSPRDFPKPWLLKKELSCIAARPIITS